MILLCVHTFFLKKKTLTLLCFSMQLWLHINLILLSKNQSTINVLSLGIILKSILNK